MFCSFVIQVGARRARREAEEDEVEPPRRRNRPARYTEDDEATEDEGEEGGDGEPDEQMPLALPNAVVRGGQGATAAMLREMAMLKADKAATERHARELAKKLARRDMKLAELGERVDSLEAPDEDTD